jgi:trehalose synthase-fused probable maltokinase
LPTCSISERWDRLFEGKAVGRLETALATYVKRHRWFAGKARTIQQAKLLDVLTIHDVAGLTGELKGRCRSPSGGLAATRILMVRIEYVEGEPETYVLPVVFAQGAQEANLLGDRPGAGMISITRTDADEQATLCDTTHEVEFWLLLYDAIVEGRTLSGLHGRAASLQTEALSRVGKEISLETSIHGGEQSNTSAILGGRFILKLFRRVSEGENPDLEIGRYLTEQTQLTCVPRLAGALEYRHRDGHVYTLAVLHEHVANEGDGWVYTQNEIGLFLEHIESVLSGSPPAEVLPAGVSLVERAQRNPPTAAQEVIGPYLQSAELLGKRTAELHLALASGEERSFAPEPFTKLYQRSLYQSMRSNARRTLSLLRRRQPQLTGAVAHQAERLLEQEQSLLERFHQVAERRITAQRIRCHGDFHLGQVLHTGKDFVIIDFEGEPGHPIGERRIKASPLRDVAGMIRSFHYAVHAAIRSPQYESLLPSAGSSNLMPWLTVWYLWTAASFLKAYLSEASRGSFLPNPRDTDELEILLNAYLLEKAVYELGYELNNRPHWAPIPLEGILQLLENE